MSSEIGNEIERVACAVFERFAFAFADPASCDEAEVPDSALCAQVRFSGMAQGRLCMLSTYGNVQEIAASALGIDEPAAESVAPDMLKELTNQICGQMLTTLAGAHAAIELGIPECCTVSSEEWKALSQQENTVCLLVDAMEPVLIHFDFEPVQTGTVS